MNNNEINNEQEQKVESVNNASSFESLPESPEVSNNYIRGGLFGCVFSLVGVAVWILLGLVGFYASIAAYLIGLFFYLGLRKGPIKITKKVLIVITVYAIVVSLLSNYISFAIEVMRAIRENGETSTFFTSLFLDTPYNLINNSEILGTFLLNNALALLFACLGAYSIYKYIVNRSK